MLQKLVSDQHITANMETALSERQFEVWFQPQYNHVTGALVGAEALVRWRQPKKGIVPPGDFIPLFEQNGFIYELDKYVWREACRYLRKWIDAGVSPMSVSVNVSRYDVFRTDLIEVITGIIKEFDIPLELLHLEITESAFAKSTKLIVGIVKKPVDLGFTVEIDDFGSGYSSLNTLKSVPAQVVKLDMRFLEGEEDANRGGNILESIVRMTKWLGMSVIAEGVETREQGDFLKSIGCSCVQGYLYSRPMPAEDYEALFMETRREKPLPVLETAENLNNDMFWNPESMDSLIFNSYVGAACICEYCGGEVELLRANDKYAHMLGGKDMTVDKLLKLDLTKHLDRDTCAAAYAKVEASVKTKEEITGEYLFLDVPGCPHETYIRSAMRVIASTDNRYLVYCISENITAQRASELKERQTANRLQALLDNINCGVTATATVTDGEHAGLIFANDKYYELLGYTREQYSEEIGADVFAAICYEDRDYAENIIDRTYATGKSATMEYRALRRDGKTIWLRNYLSMTSFDGVDGPVRLCTYADITAEKHTAQDLLDNLPCGAGICEVSDGDAHMTYINKKYFTYFTHSIGARRTPSVFSVIHPDDLALLRRAIGDILRDCGESSCVLRILDGQGKYITFRLSGVAMKSDGGKRSIYVTFFPVAQEELSFSEMLPVALEKMMESSSDLSFIKDKDLRYICCSRTFARMVGLENEKVIAGMTDHDLFDSELADRYVSDDRRLMESGESIIDMVESLPSKDGRNRYLSTSKYLLFDSEGNAIGIYGTGHDITRTREAEKRQKFLINNIPGGVAVYEGKWSTLDSIRLTYFSNGFCRLFGYTREEYEKLGRANPTGLVEKEFLPGFIKQIEALVINGTTIDYLYRARTKEGGCRWINVKAVPGDKHGENMTVNAVFFDVTARQEALEHLRVSEEENRLAIQHSKNVVCRFDVTSKKLKVSSNINAIFELPQVIEDVPFGQVRDGRISTETVGAYVGFYEQIIRGENNGSVVYQRRSTQGWRWIEAHSSTIFSSGGAPVSAVISFLDVTESFEKDIAYKKWIQSLHNKDPRSYSLFRCNVSGKTFFDTTEGSLLHIDFEPGPFNFDDHTEEYAIRFVCEEDRERFRAFLTVDSLLNKFDRGERIITLEYRETLTDEYRWLRLTVDLVEYSHSGDVEAYLLFEDIDKSKRAELISIEQAEKDPLTGVLNRKAFAEKVNQFVGASKPGVSHALIILDIDGFKLVNDAFGHGAGDQVLIDIANLLRRTFRRDDLVGRLGGDEFVVFLNNIPDERLAAEKAKQICELSRKAFSAEVRISGSAGIALYPHDGTDFDTLYKKSDEALYFVKGSGRDNFAFYHEDMKDEHLKLEAESAEQAGSRPEEKKRRMLIVDDNIIDNEMMANIFRKDFIIEEVKDGSTALIRLRHYGSAISVVLLDLLMPGMDGFTVLEKIQQNPDMRAIPVIVVSGANDSGTGLRAIRGGAADFVMKPIDPEVLKIRVQSAVSKAENERLRAKNSLLELQSDETACYETVLDEIGMAVAALDRITGMFSYSGSISERLWGKYDDRDLWTVFQSDSVADAETVGSIRRLVDDVADGRRRAGESAEVRLKTPSGALHSFRVNIYKLADAQGRALKIILTFKDLDAETRR